jgi:NADH:ubiquinone oxidoreductase subunit 2 (subunit N)
MWDWMFDAFFWVAVPVALLEALRIARSERKRQRRSMSGAIAYGGLELLALGFCAVTSSPLLFMLVAVIRIGIIHARERQWWARGVVKTSLLVVSAGLLMVLGHVDSFADAASANLDETSRLVILLLLCAACVVAILPVRVSDEPKETLAAPLTLIAFVRIALPLSAAEPRFAVVVPVVAVAVSLLCALWLLSAGTRANQFEPATLVSELLVCERGVVLSFVWLGLAAGEHLAGVGALLEWWSGALALLALEASLRRRPLTKPMAFFALGMAVCLPGTVGFVAEDLLAHGLLELRPALAVAFVVVAALNAAALYLALVNIIVDVRGHDPHQQQLPEIRPSFMMLGAAGLSLVIGLFPGPFVAEAAEAHEEIAWAIPASHTDESSEPETKPGASGKSLIGVITAP